VSVVVFNDPVKGDSVKYPIVMRCGIRNFDDSINFNLRASFVDKRPKGISCDEPGVDIVIQHPSPEDCKFIPVVWEEDPGLLGLLVRCFNVRFERCDCGRVFFVSVEVFEGIVKSRSIPEWGSLFERREVAAKMTLPTPTPAASLKVHPVRSTDDSNSVSLRSLELFEVRIYPKVKRVLFTNVWDRHARSSTKRMIEL